MANRAALATPRDVFPSNGDVIEVDEDTTQITFSFTCQCDLLSWLRTEIYDATTNELVGHFFSPRDGTIGTFHKGETYAHNFLLEVFPTLLTELFVSGYHYKYKMILYTNFPDEDGTYYDEPNCCVPFASGKLIQAASPSALFIQSGITKNLSPYYYNEGEEDEKLVGCTYIRIGNNERMITSYDKDTGYIILAGGFPDDFLDEDSTPQYYLYCNFIETSGGNENNSYDYYVRNPISSKTTVAHNGYGTMNLSATYVHPNKIGMESYRFKIYSLSGNNYLDGTIQDSDDDSIDYKHIPIETGITENLINKVITIATNDSTIDSNGQVTDGYIRTITAYNSETGIATLSTRLSKVPNVATVYSISLSEETLIEDSGEIYNYELDYNSIAYLFGQQFRIETILTSYEKQQYNQAITKSFDEPTGDNSITKAEYSIDRSNQQVTITLTTSVTTYPLMVYRRESGTTIWKYQGIIITNNIKNFVDCTAQNGKTYEYSFVERDGALSETDYSDAFTSAPYILSNITPSWRGWTISSLIPFDKYAEEGNSVNSVFSYYTSNFKDTYIVGSTWKFISDINSGDITKNLGIQTHVGTSTYPTTTRTNNAYTSGSFTANLLSVSCPNNEIVDDIERIEKWEEFINSDNPFLLKSAKGDAWIVRISDNTSRTYTESTQPVLTSATYSWVEVTDIDDAIVASRAN